MTRVQPDDPERCINSQTEGFDNTHGWKVCRECGRALTGGKGVLPTHRIRGETTRTLDATRDQLVAAGIRPYGR